MKIVPLVHMQNNVKRQIKLYCSVSNYELTSMHQEVIENLGKYQGAPWMNRSIQAEGTFGIIKTTVGIKELSKRDKICIA